MPMPQPQPGILGIDLYQGGDSAVPGVADVVKLSSNENPLGPPPSAVEAARRAAEDMHLYPSTDHAALRQAIAETHDLDPERIVCGVGSDEILHLLAQAFAGPGDEVLHTEHGFLMYPIVAKAAGATPVQAPESMRRVDVARLLDRASAATKLTFVANPANPTGTTIPAQDIARLADALPGLLVLDGAYAEYAEDASLKLAEARDDMVVTRTFSKAYGLGGMRVGWAYGPRAVIDVLNRIRGPFNLSAVALAAAEAAMRDRARLRETVETNARLRAELTDGLRRMGLQVDDSEANFVLARFASEAEASACDAHLRSSGVIVRHPRAYGFPEALRITVGDAEGVRRTLDGIAAFRAAQEAA